MRIISKFKDYYDFVAHNYRDDTIVYVRNSVPTGKCIQYIKSNKYGLSSATLLPEIEVAYLFVAGDIHVVSLNADKPVLIDNDKNASVVLERINKNRYFWDKKVYTSLAPLFCDRIQDSLPNLVQYAKENNAPVFTFKCGYDGFYAGKAVPNLGEVGLASLVSPMDMFLKIQQFITNVIKKNPDITPPVITNDKTRIVSHGFDLKTSFRGK